MELCRMSLHFKCRKQNDFIPVNPFMVSKKNLREKLYETIYAPIQLNLRQTNPRIN